MPYFYTACLCIYFFSGVASPSSDFSSTTTNLVFIPDTAEMMMCTDISIIDDTAVENNESFSVLLNTSVAGVTTAPSVGQVTILDDDSTCFTVWSLHSSE